MRPGWSIRQALPSAVPWCLPTTLQHAAPPMPIGALCGSVPSKSSGACDELRRGTAPQEEAACCTHGLYTSGSCMVYGRVHDDHTPQWVRYPTGASLPAIFDAAICVCDLSPPYLLAGACHGPTSCHAPPGDFQTPCICVYVCVCPPGDFQTPQAPTTLGAPPRDVTDTRRAMPYPSSVQQLSSACSSGRHHP